MQFDAKRKGYLVNLLIFGEAINQLLSVLSHVALICEDKTLPHHHR